MNRHVRPLLSQLLGVDMVRVRPHAGRLCTMVGNACLHSVTAPEDTRINVIMSFDYPSAQYRQAANLDQYLFTTKQSVDKPNYAT